jgi:hypothetical protein
MWTTRSESEAFCEGPLARVDSTEAVARLIVRQEPNEGYNPFQRSDLLPPKKRDIENTCGEQDGLSVDRCRGLSADELIARSALRAEVSNARRVERGKAPNQFPAGASVAEVSDLRAIGSPGLPGRQVVFVYDDAMEDNAEHAVIRLSEHVPEEEVALVLLDLKNAFKERIAP